MNFQNKVVVVTGGASGIGLACCREFSQRRATVAVVDLDESQCSSSCHPKTNGSCSRPRPTPRAASRDRRRGPQNEWSELLPNPQLRQHERVIKRDLLQIIITPRRATVSRRHIGLKQ